ncbi:Hypothetical protein Minf_2088 [Methylacidiphilum infernorum V4]|uniref:Uncharacterized protein n=1 Tax=Methylacidiphilum infernorum (isolate V4) TaxID=481448 RepID=B3DZ50_METI4|nr:Hypothetical protein Minf_2088 [Methylacidiphilum infernorum V4]
MFDTTDQPGIKKKSILNQSICPLHAPRASHYNEKKRKGEDSPSFPCQCINTLPFMAIEQSAR